ncbi:Uncharacterised protein [Candidatus Burarchaeum australiense]|nr:Uncharacterised protein [Candidatus Burarchaeum australiense]
MAKNPKADAPTQGSVRIAFSTAGKDFHLEVRGGKLEDCEKTFERLFNKVKLAHEPEDSHYG